MNSSSRLIGVVLASAILAAGCAAPAPPGGKTRAEVRQDLQTALDSGWRPPSGEAVGYPGPFPRSGPPQRASGRGGHRAG